MLRAGAISEKVRILQTDLKLEPCKSAWDSVCFVQEVFQTMHDAMMGIEAN